MSRVEFVRIALPTGALGGWPVLIDALERAKEATGLSLTFGGLIDQIRNQTDPKPDEPTGLGAVIEDAEGHSWIRHGDGPAAWMLAGASPSNRDTYPYCQIAAVRVLSYGVSSDE